VRKVVCSFPRQSDSWVFDELYRAGKVELELVPVQSSNRMQFLEQGKIDMMIATMSDRKDRREIVGIVGPNYYTSGTNVMSPKALALTNWEQLRGKPVCGKQGAFYNTIVEERYGAQIIAFTGNAEAKQALRDKKCIAWARGLFDALTPRATGGVYVNFMPEDEAQRVAAGAYGPNFERLSALKAKYDPMNLFRLNANIPTRA